jgi:hypothetical protein
VLGVVELEKPKDAWCPHAHKASGCAIYARRPTTCQNFVCLWLAGAGPADMRPDRVHGVLCPDGTGEHIQLVEDPGYPGHATVALKGFIDNFVADGVHHVVVISGARRELFAREDRVAALRGEFRLRETHGDVAVTDWTLDA